jgi:hypothetical protein
MAFATKHNGGRSQTNFNFMQIGGEYPFINALKTAQEWSLMDNSGEPLPTDLDANGYLTSAAVITNNGGVKTVFYVPTQAARPGNYVITWTGNGTVFCGMNNTLVSGSKTGSGGAGRYVFSTTDDLFTIGISALPVTDLKVFHEDDETALNAGEIFGTKFKARLAEANFGVYRFLNWQQGNTTNATNYASLKPTTYVFYEGSEFRSGIYAGSASLSGVTYSVSAPSLMVDGTSWSGLTDKATVSIKFGTAFTSKSSTFSNGSQNISVTSHGLSVNDRLRFNLDPNNSSAIPTNFAAETNYYVVNVPDANTIRVSATQGGAAITAGSAQTGLIYCSAILYLNVGSTGAKEILDSYSNPLAIGGNSYPVTSKLATLVYDSTLDKWIKWGGDVGLGAKGILNGCHPTLCFQLCAEMGAHPWFVGPHLAMDPITDLMPTLAAYCRDNAPSWMKPIYEGPNELWNSFGGFFQTTHANAKSAAYGWSGGYNSWYGKIMSVLGQAISTVYSADRTRYDVVAGMQTVAGASPTGSDDRLKSTEYINQVPAAQSPYTKSAACDWVTAIAVATYWNSEYRDVAETGWATEYTTASATQKTAIAKAYIDGCSVLGSRQDTIPALTTIYSNWKSWALDMPTPVRQMFAYEGCYSPDYIGDTAIDTLRYAGKSVENMGGQLTAMYHALTKLSDSTFTAKYPSNFILGDFTSPGFYAGGATVYIWSIFLGDIYAATTPQWDAICRYNAARRASNLRLGLHS